MWALAPRAESCRHLTVDQSSTLRCDGKTRAAERVNQTALHRPTPCATADHSVNVRSNPIAHRPSNQRIIVYRNLQPTDTVHETLCAPVGPRVDKMRIFRVPIVAAASCAILAFAVKAASQ